MQCSVPQTTFHSPACMYDSHDTQLVPWRLDIWSSRYPAEIAPVFGNPCLVSAGIANTRQWSAVFEHFSLGIHVLKHWGKGRSCTSCHVLVMHHSELALPRCTPLIPMRCEKFRSLLVAFQAADRRYPLTPPTDGRTDGQTGASYLPKNLFRCA